MFLISFLRVGSLRSTARGGFKMVVWFLWRIFFRFTRNGSLTLISKAGFLPHSVAFCCQMLFMRRDMRKKNDGERLRCSLSDLGSSFIKFGQILSVRADLVGDKMANELRQLQDQLPPFKNAESVLERALGKPVDQLFKRFDAEPVAAASVAQVHYAVTLEGKEVAVKILRPGIAKAFKRDIKFFFTLARIAEFLSSKLRRLGATQVIALYEEWTYRELDLTLEASSASQLAENMKDEKEFYIPKVDWTKVSQKVLTLEWVEGCRIDDFETLKRNGLDPKKLLGRSVDIFFLQVFRDGFFHADIHPGNLLIRQDGVLVPVDFGITGRIDLSLKNFLADTLVGFVTRDYERVARAHATAGYLPKGQTVESLTQACRAIGEPLFGNSLENVSFAQLMFKVISISDRFELPVQMRLLLLHKTMLQAEGVGQIIDPDLNIWLLSQGLIGDWIRKNRSLRKRVKMAIGDFSSDARRIPKLMTRIEKFLDQANTASNHKKGGFAYGVVFGALGGGLIVGIGWLFLLS